MVEISDEERQERDALHLDRKAWRQRTEKFKRVGHLTEGQKAELAIYEESHRVAGEQIKKRAKAYGVKWGRSPWDN